MLGKLIKHEFSQTGRTLWPIFVGGATLLLLTKLLMTLNYRPFLTATQENGGTVIRQNQIVSMLTGLFIFLFITSIIVLVISVMLVAVQRFYRLLGDEGYTMFTLPVTSTQHLWAKTIVGAAWVLAAVVYLFFSVYWLVITPAIAHDMKMTGLTNATTGQAVLAFTILTLCMVVGLLGALWMAYLSCTWGARFPQQRTVASIGFFFLLQVAVQIIGMILLVVWVLCMGNDGMTALGDWLNYSMLNNPLQMLNTILGVCLGVVATCCAVFYALLHHSLKKNLNLA